MAIFIGFLTFIMVLVSLFLILLVLVQLPKKEAGVGMAFGAGMSEMLLGAGSGNVLTRITKYTVGIFLVLALFLSIMRSHQARNSGLGVTRAIEEQARSAPGGATTPAPVAPPFQQLPGVTGVVSSPVTTTNAAVTNALVTPLLVPGTPDAAPLETATPAPVVPAPAIPAPTNPPEGN